MEKIRNFKISIIVPVYNVRNYISECFNSIVAQTFKEKTECIFVDDCGQDDSIEILNKLISHYQGCIDFKICHHDKNKGQSAARNTGIKKSTGEYLLFIDSDDKITNDCLDILYGLVNKYPKVDIVQGSAISKNSILSMRGKNVPEYSDDYEWIRKSLLSRYVFPITPWNKLVNRNFLIKNNLFFKEGLIHEDELWHFFLAKHVHSIACSFKETYFYRENPNGIMLGNRFEGCRLEPVLEQMAKNVSTPYPTCDIECIGSFLEENKGKLNENEIISNIKYCEFIVKTLLYIVNKVNTTSKKSLEGLLYRIIRKLLEFFVNKTFHE